MACFWKRIIRNEHRGRLAGSGPRSRRGANQPAVLAAVPTSTHRSRRRASSALDARSTFRSLLSKTSWLPAGQQEHGGIIRAGAKLLYAFRRSDRAEDHGHHEEGLRRAYCVASSKHPDGFNYAYPTARSW